MSPVERMYQDKLAQIKKHIGMLQEGSLPEFLKRTKKIELQYRERLRQNEIAKTVDVSTTVQKILRREFCLKKQVLLPSIQ